MGEPKRALKRREVHGALINKRWCNMHGAYDGAG